MPISKIIILFHIFRPRLAIFGEAEAAKCCFCFWWQLHRKLILKSSVKFLEVVVLVFICIFQYKKPTFKPGQTPIKYSLHNHKSNRYYKVYKPTIKSHKVQLQKTHITMPTLIHLQKQAHLFSSGSLLAIGWFTEPWPKNNTW